MANIISIKVKKNGKIYLTLEISEEELKALKGNTKEILIFSLENLNYETRLVQRGRKESTKYFLLPKGLREDISPNSALSNKFKCKDGFIFAYFISNKEEK